MQSDKWKHWQKLSVAQRLHKVLQRAHIRSKDILEFSQSLWGLRRGVSEPLQGEAPGPELLWVAAWQLPAAVHEQHRCWHKEQRVTCVMRVTVTGRSCG